METELDHILRKDYERIHECAVAVEWTTEGRRKMEDGRTKDNVARWR